MQLALYQTEIVKEGGWDGDKRWRGAGSRLSTSLSTGLSSLSHMQAKESSEEGVGTAAGDGVSSLAVGKEGDELKV